MMSRQRPSTRHLDRMGAHLENARAANEQQRATLARLRLATEAGDLSAEEAADLQRRYGRELETSEAQVERLERVLREERARHAA